MVDPQIEERALELANRRKCLDCKGMSNFVIDLFGEITCSGCTSEVRLVSSLDLRKIIVHVKRDEG